MSEPKRPTYYIVESNNCLYEATKSQVKRDEGLYVSKADYDRLKAEVERLTKAGDAMAENCEAMTSSEYDSYDSDLMKFVKAWHAAKGVQS